MRLTRRSIITTAAASALALGLAACGGGSEDPAETPDAGETPSGDPESISLVLPPEGWPEGVAMTYLWEAILEEDGYDVSVESAGDMGVTYTALAGGQFDLFFDAWLPLTHGDYFETYSDLERLGAWYDEAVLTIAVNEDSPVTSLADLAENADAYDNRIVGIEAGAGLTRVTNEEVIPTYGLEGMEFIESSSTTMLTELRSAVDDGRDIVVTLWRPHWAYDEFPIRDLEDPEGTLGEAETIEFTGRPGFAADYPRVTELLADFTFSSEQLFELENIMFNENEGGDYRESLQQWLELHPDFIAGVLG